MTNFFKKAAFLCSTVAFLASPVTAATQIAATVNSKAISSLDLKNRVKFAIVSAGAPDTPETRKELQEQVLQTLINEQIQLQLGEEFDIKVDNATIDATIRQIEIQNNMPEGGLKKMLKSNGIPFSLLRSNIESTLIWRQYIRGRYGKLVQVSAQEIERAKNEREASKKETRYHLAEIYIPFSSNAEKTKARSQAEQLVAQARQGAQFSILARQFSQAPSASRGGDIGWVAKSTLPKDVQTKVAQLKPGAVTNPVQKGQGYQVLLLRDQLAPGQHARPQTVLSMKQVSIPISKDAFEFEVDEKMQKIASLASQVTNCRQVEKMTKRQNASVQVINDLPVQNLPVQMRELLAKVKVNQASKPVYTGETGMFFVVCAKKTLNPKEQTVEQIQAQLVDQKLQSVSARELRTRRNSAHIDIRTKG